MNEKSLNLTHGKLILEKYVSLTRALKPSFEDVNNCNAMGDRLPILRLIVAVLI